jgi:hypothetical protein
MEVLVLDDGKSVKKYLANPAALIYANLHTTVEVVEPFSIGKGSWLIRCREEN